MITDASIAATLLWAELAQLAEVEGTAATRRVYQVGSWTLTADPAHRTIAVDRHAQHCGIIGPGETTDLAPETARALRRDLHEHVYQVRRNHPL